MTGVGVRRRAAAVAGHRGDEPAARAAIDDADAAVRSVGLGALARLGLLDDATLVRSLRDVDPRVRRRAVELAALRPSIDLIDALDDLPEVVEVALWACGERGSELDAGTLQQVVQHARDHDDPLCRESAVAALGAIGHPDGLGAVLGATKDKPAIRRRAVIALAAFEGDAVDAALRAALDDRDWQVRQAAEELLAIDDAHDHRPDR